MKYNQLPKSDFSISALSLGCMSLGLDEKNAKQIIETAIDGGITYFDTADLYDFGQNERLVGEFLKPYRSKIHIGTKGGNEPTPDFTSWKWNATKTYLSEAVKQSLKRLQTDYIDLYQLHWPQRPVNFFGKLGYGNVEANSDREVTDLEETLVALTNEVKKGRIRHIGLSNETPWGTLKFLQLAEKHGLQKVVSVQNPYSLLNRTYEIGMSEIAKYEGVGLLAYSPLAFGYLTGKFRNGARPANARVTLYSRFSRYSNPESEWATEAYAQLAEKHGLSLTQLALAFIKQQFFVTSTIIGATNLDQLKENIQAFEINLSEEILQEIDAIHRQQPNPAP